MSAVDTPPVRCLDIARALAAADRPASDISLADPIASHLVRCSPCAAFEAQLLLLATAARDASRQFEHELPVDFERRLLHRLCG